MSLKAIAEEALARLKAGETAHETKKETEVKHAERANPCFSGGGGGFTPMKHVEPQKTAKNDLCFTVSVLRGETHETSLPADIVAGLARLRGMRPPRIKSPDVWSTVVADAARLAAEGWAAQALALGWKDKELFGTCGTSGGNSTQEGLAVWLAGRRVLLLDALSCIVDVGAGTRAVFYGRSVRPGGIFIWDLGKATVQHGR
jgi:hypothetical protein